MTTQKFMGRYQLVDRLTAQVGGNGELAKHILIKRGHMSPSGHLTAEGRRRDAMTASERAKDRESKRTGTPTSQLTYHAKTNRATQSGTSKISGAKNVRR